MADNEEVKVPLMSTGQPSTLKNWRDITAATFGENSAATIFLQEKIDKQGEDEPVLSDEGQLIYALWQIHEQGMLIAALDHIEEEFPNE